MSTTPLRRAVPAALAGNAFEFYDFITYTFFAIQIGQAFFPSSNATLSLLGAFATFGAGFVSRPLGALVIGAYADRRGRRAGMLLSMVLMGLGSALLALTPGYAVLGWAAPVLAIMARLIQGLALGGEVGATTAFLIEAVPPGQRGLAASWQSASQGIATMAGALVGFILAHQLDPAALAGWGWRVALLAGTLIVPLAIVLRRTLPDGPARPLQGMRGPVGGPVPLRVLACGVLLVSSATTTTYAFLYMTTYAQHTLHLSAVIGMAGSLANSSMLIVVSLLAGLASDRHGRRPVAIFGQIAYALALLPCFVWLVGTPGLASFFGANLVLSVTARIGPAVALAAIAESLPDAWRARGFALAYGLPVTILGGTTQPVIVLLIAWAHTPWALAWFMAGSALLGLGAALALPETRPETA